MFARRVGWGMLAASAALSALVLGAGVSFRAAQTPHEARPAGVSRSESPPLPAEGWTVFQTEPAAQAGPSAGRFRLAGTFFEYGEGREAGRMAILDELQTREQFLVREGARVGPTRVVSIFHNRVVLREQGREQVVWLSFAPAESAAGEGDGQAQDAGTGPAEPNPFGKRVAENRWVFRRDSLTGYYQEVLEDPGRLAALFSSMKPLYDENRITGYHLDIEGEENFFAATGLRQGDVIRKVNSMPMTNRRRAEYFIREFAADRVNAFVLEVEREGKAEKLIYLVR
ncbi:MAG: hypothetical protein JXR37_21915 [Kiritimatiellae bacterium]|nr:hypothetical protein [Kiritimatiellia bacterium]